MQDEHRFIDRVLLPASAQFAVKSHHPLRFRRGQVTDDNTADSFMIEENRGTARTDENRCSPAHEKRIGVVDLKASTAHQFNGEQVKWAACLKSANCFFKVL